jgi:hypothetical protein
VNEHRWSPTCERPLDLFRPVGIDPTGEDGPTKRQAGGPRFRQTSAGLYVPAEVDSTVVEQRILEQAQRIRGEGAITGWAALRWRGATFFDGTGPRGEGQVPVPLAVGQARLRPDPRIEISQAQFAPSERTKTGGIWCATVQRALFDAMRLAPDLRAAVVCMDMAAAARLTSVALMTTYVTMRPAWTGVPLVRQALALASNGSRSPQETRMRLVWVLDALLPSPLCNVPVFSLHGGLLGYPDIFDPVSGTIGEYDGDDHKDAARHRRDVSREAAFRDHGLEYFTVVGGDLQNRSLVVNRMHSARARSRFDPPDERLWTLDPPPWWKLEPDLDTHLLLTGEAPMLVRT